MSKAVLVIDKPKNCYECSLCAEEVIYGKTEFVCKGYGSIIESLDGNDWCPLRPMPIKNGMTVNSNAEYLMSLSDEEKRAYAFGLNIGRNMCIDEITGETE